WRSQLYGRSGGWLSPVSLSGAERSGLSRHFRRENRSPKRQDTIVPHIYEPNSSSSRRLCRRQASDRLVSSEGTDNCKSVSCCWSDEKTDKASTFTDLSEESRKRLTSSELSVLSPRECGRERPPAEA